jgi:site-specific DNA-methyltransferase (adenine-specific)
VIADIPYNVGNYAYGSNPAWYEGGDNANGESKLAGKSFFKTDEDFRISELLAFVPRMMKPERPKETGVAPCMVIFCAFLKNYLAPLLKRFIVFISEHGNICCLLEKKLIKFFPVF